MVSLNTSADNVLRNHLTNPFLVLSLSVEATAQQIERQGQKLLMMLSAGIHEGSCYSTPLGQRERTAEMIREALTELRDPDQRLVHEFWAKGLQC